MLTVMSIPPSVQMPQSVEIEQREGKDGSYEWAKVLNVWSGNPDRFHYSPAREVDGEEKKAFARVTAFYNDPNTDKPSIYSLIFFDEDADLINEQLITQLNKARFRLEGTFNLREFEDKDGETRHSQDIICKSGAIVSLKPYFPAYNGGNGAAYVAPTPEQGEAQAAPPAEEPKGYVSDMAHEDDIAGPLSPSDDVPF